MENFRANNGAIPRIGVIGCGNIGSWLDEDKDLPYALSHCGAYQLLKIPILALADPNEARLQTAGNKRNVKKLYTNAIDLIQKEAIDILNICTPTSIRYSLIKKAVENKVKVIICEKPLANTVEEGEKIKALIEQSDTQLIVNYSRRWDVIIQKIKSLIQTKQIGEIQHISAIYGKGLLNNGSHLINLFQFFFGNNYTVEYTKIVSDDMPEKGKTMHAVLHGHWNNQTFPIFLKAVNHQMFSLFEIDIVGTEKRIKISESGLTIEFQQVIEDTRFKGYKALQKEKISKDSYYDTMANMIKEAIHIFQNKQEDSVSSISDALDTLKIIDTIYQT